MFRVVIFDNVSKEDEEKFLLEYLAPNINRLDPRGVLKYLDNRDKEYRAREARQEFDFIIMAKEYSSVEEVIGNTHHSVKGIIILRGSIVLFLDRTKPIDSTEFWSIFHTEVYKRERGVM